MPVAGLSVCQSRGSEVACGVVLKEDADKREVTRGSNVVNEVLALGTLVVQVCMWSLLISSVGGSVHE